MDKEKIKKVLKKILIVFVILSAILFWVENILVYLFWDDIPDFYNGGPYVPIESVGYIGNISQL